MKNFPVTVSVIIPFYSELDWLMEALASVYSQTYQNFEVILINDGSNEDISIISFKYPLVRIITIKNSGPGVARNKGIKIAQGEFIAFLDSDDLWHPKKLELQIHHMKKYNIQWSHTNYERFWNNKTKIEKVECGNMKGDIIPMMFVSCSIATPCVMIRSTVLFDAPSLRFSEEKRVGEDSYFWYLLAERYQLGFLDEYLTQVRLRGKNAAFQAYLQLKSRADGWLFITKLFENSEVTFLHKLIRLGYRACKIGFDFVSFFKFNEKTREYVSRIVYLFPYMYFKLINRLYN
jgi:teichuronic acid biosynthesis glycosyltransferase TuaG